MTGRLFIVFIAMITMAAGSTIADTHIVHPDGTGDYSTIQAAVDAAGDGDIVELTAGTFTGYGNQKIDYVGKAISIVGQSGPELTIIDGAADSSVVNFVSGEDASSTLESVTIRNGAGMYYEPPYYPLGRYGGAICCLFSSPTIRNCILHSNTADHGGGMWCYDASPTVTDCTFRNNSSSTAGGGIHSSRSELTMVDCVVSENSTSGGGNYNGGGGLHISRGALYMMDCEVSLNTSPNGGGFGMHLFAELTLENCTIASNSASHWGGAIQNTQCFITMTNCQVVENYCAGQGGGIYLYACDDEPYVSLVDCTIAHNVAGGAGGAIACDGSTVNLNDCTLAENETGSFGGGILLQNASFTNVERTIVAFSVGDAVSCWGYSEATLACCDLYGNTSGDWTGCIAGQNGVNGNISEDPLFCGTTDGSSPTLHSSVSPYSLQMTSCCLPGNHPDGYDCGLIGAHNQGCASILPGNDPSLPKLGETATVEPTTWGRIKAGYR